MKFFFCFSSQKTAAEVKKIEQIKAELAKLDNDLAVDVAILRKQIEDACLHYANIQLSIYIMYLF